MQLPSSSTIIIVVFPPSRSMESLLVNVTENDSFPSTKVSSKIPNRSQSSGLLVESMTRLGEGGMYSSGPVDEHYKGSSTMAICR